MMTIVINIATTAIGTIVDKNLTLSTLF